MPMNPGFFMIELSYTTVIVVLCFFVYHKTKEIYDLTKYKGIKYFRTSFLLFGLAYLMRFLFQVFLIGFAPHLQFHAGRGIFFPLMLVFTAYFSTIAIFYLAYSTIWKRIRFEQFVLFSNLIAVLVAVVSFISRAPFTIMLVQLPVLIFTLLAILMKHKRKHSNTKLLYFLISLFWLVNLYIMGPRWLLPFEAKMLLQVISIIVFVAIIYKVNKWIK